MFVSRICHASDFWDLRLCLIILKPTIRGHCILLLAEQGALHKLTFKFLRRELWPQVTWGLQDFFCKYFKSKSLTHHFRWRMKFVDKTKENETVCKIVSASIETDSIVISYQGPIFTLWEELISISTLEMIALTSYWSPGPIAASHWLPGFQELHQTPDPSLIISCDHILHLSLIVTRPVPPTKSHDTKN